jgi:hypothetical protein
MIGAAVAFAMGAATLPPIDQCAGDPSFAAFRSNLIRIVERRDAKALVAILSDTVMVDFDNSTGPRAFARAWRLNGRKPAESRVWPELKAVMKLGCARVGAARVMPSFLAQLPGSDQFEKFIALPGAKLKQSAALDSRTLATLHFHVVSFRDSNAPDGWLGVALPDGRQGYVRRDEVRAALEYRA